MSKFSKKDPLLVALSDEQRLLENQRIATAEFRMRSESKSTTHSKTRMSLFGWIGAVACGLLVAAFLALQPNQPANIPVAVAHTSEGQDNFRAPAGVSIERSIASDALVIPVSDLDASLSFYRNSLGFESQATLTENSAQLARGTLRIILVEQTGPTRAPTSIQVQVSDIGSLSRSLEASGITHTSGDVLQFKDPDGNSWMLTQ